MHTFFINTSEEDLLSNKDILDIEEINRDLILLNCPLRQWKDKEKGYIGCANRIGELIDNYREINNDFNLVIYVDLVTIPDYISAVKSDNDNEKTACLYALYCVIFNYIKKTLIRELNDHAREPLEIILIYEENKGKKVSFDLNINENRKILIEQIGKVIGFPSRDQLQTLLTEQFKDLYLKREEINKLENDALRNEHRIRVNITNEMVNLLIENLNYLSKGSAFEEQYEYYDDKLRYMLARVVDNADIEELRGLSSKVCKFIFKGKNNQSQVFIFKNPCL